jgi:Tfp pilus assembly protein PilF/peroxiredoxin
MLDRRPHQGRISRRALLKTLRYVPGLFLPAPLLAFERRFESRLGVPLPNSFADQRVTPHYPATSPLDEMLRLVPAGTDKFVTEKHAREIEELLGSWGRELTAGRRSFSIFSDPTLRASSLRPSAEKNIRKDAVVAVTWKQFTTDFVLWRDGFLDELKAYFAFFTSLKTAELQITGIRELSTTPLQVAADIRYAFVGQNRRGEQEQRIGTWHTEWMKKAEQWQVGKFQWADETVSTATAAWFADASSTGFGHLASYQEQLLRGADYWRTVLDGAAGVDVYGNQGIAVGDFDNDGFDDIYVCQPAGLPNLLYRNRGDGTFEDVTHSAGVDVLDSTSCALFADFENRDRQDLLVVTSAGPLLFVNEGNGRFSPKPDVFKFAHPPQGTFTHAAIADYDHDGRLDVYFCVYNYYAGLDQYRYPSPYFDARNGPPNFLFHNSGNWSFEDRTEASGLKVDNDRYSFACAWGDLNGNGGPDLYVANDFGRSNLYRNNGDGTFTSVATEAGVEDVGAGMSACWLDFDGDGNQDIYVANMWSAAGLRVSTQENFHADDPENIRALYRRHARGNSLYQNLGGGAFRNVAADRNAEFGRWAWSSDSFDFDHDGFPDLYIANGYVSGAESDVSSFFWRQVVGNSPRDLSPAAKYEHAWNTINELIRSDHSWSGYERNVLYCNNQDGGFSDVSGLSGIDFPDDSRAFALADFDHDGRLEILLKNRNAPQLRLLRNIMQGIGNSIAFRVCGTKSNRDAIGAAVTVEAQGRRQTKYLQAGSGFLSQQTKQLFFGVGDIGGFVRAMVRWPSGLVQAFDRLPVNHCVELIEGSNDFRSEGFSTPKSVNASRTPQTELQSLPTHVDTWCLQPLHAPSFELNDTTGKQWRLEAISGSKLLMFWASNSEASLQQLRSLRDNRRLNSATSIVTVNAEDPPNEAALRSLAVHERLPFPILLPTPEVVGIYNIVYRYLFERHRDMSLPTSFLIDQAGMIVKVYQGETTAEKILSDLTSIPRTPEEHMKKGLPFPGTLHLGAFQRNDFTYGVAFFQRGYLDAATDAFLQVISEKPDDAEAHYNLGTLYLRRNDLVMARAELEKTLQFKPKHPEAWNNLGMVAAEEGKTEEAATNFKQSLALRPDYDVALLNLGNMYRRQRRFAEAEPLLGRAVQVAPENPEASYSMAMLYAQQNQADPAEHNFQRALSLRPGYADALNNFGVLLVREKRYSEAEERFKACIQDNPDFDQAYLNLARLYLVLNDKTKARDTLETLLQRQPQNDMARQTLKMLE